MIRTHPVFGYIQNASDTELEGWLGRLLGYIRELAPRDEERRVNLQLRNIRALCDQITDEQGHRKAMRVRVRG